MSSLLSQQDMSHLQRLEESLWREATRFDRDYMERILSADFVEFGRSGRVYDRAAIVAAPRGSIDAVLPLPDFAARLISPDVALVTYNSLVTYDGVVEQGRRSSIWSRTADGWGLRFHQGTAYPSTAPG